MSDRPRPPGAGPDPTGPKGDPGGGDRPPASWPFWVTGTVVAFAGALLVRVIAPRTSAPAPWTVVGFVLALVGLFTITLGTRRKYTYLARRRDDGRPPGT